MSFANTNYSYPGQEYRGYPDLTLHPASYQNSPTNPPEQTFTYFSQTSSPYSTPSPIEQTSTYFPQTSSPPDYSQTNSPVSTPPVNPDYHDNWFQENTQALREKCKTVARSVLPQEPVNRETPTRDQKKPFKLVILDFFRPQRNYHFGQTTVNNYCNGPSQPAPMNRKREKDKQEEVNSLIRVASAVVGLITTFIGAYLFGSFSEKKEQINRQLNELKELNPSSLIRLLSKLNF